MNSTEKIQKAQDDVATLQSKLDGVQNLLDKAEKISVAGEVAKKRAEQLLVVSAVLIAIGIVLLALGGKKKRSNGS